MNVDAWSAGEEDPGRAKRLAVGYAVGAAILALSVAVGATVKSAAAPAEEEDVIDVKLAQTATAAPPPPPPPPPVEAPKPVPAGPMPRKAIMAPKEVPTDAPPESDKPPTPASDEDPYADGKGGTKGGSYDGNGVGPVPTAPAPTTAAPPPPPPPPPPPRVAGPINLPEDGTPPVALSNAPPPYPEEARKGGVEAVIVVKFVVTESGDVTGVSIVRGHPMFDAAVLSAVRSWRYQPALVDGRPVPVYRTARIPFKLKT